MTTIHETRTVKAVFDDDTIRVYQALHNVQADEALSLGTFGSRFKKQKFSWLKPSFLWTMHLCNWGTKKGQSRILAIDMQREGFDRIYREAIHTVYVKELYDSIEQWKQLFESTDARCQWDLGRDEHGDQLKTPVLQLGIRNEMARLYVDEWVVKISDITEMVQYIRGLRDLGQSIADMLPQEKHYPL